MTKRSRWGSPSQKRTSSVSVRRRCPYASRASLWPWLSRGNASYRSGVSPGADATSDPLMSRARAGHRRTSGYPANRLLSNAYRPSSIRRSDPGPGFGIPGGQMDVGHIIQHARERAAPAIAVGISCSRSRTDPIGLHRWAVVADSLDSWASCASCLGFPSVLRPPTGHA
jgi:hypothetical protein